MKTLLDRFFHYIVYDIRTRKPEVMSEKWVIHMQIWYQDLRYRFAAFLMRHPKRALYSGLTIFMVAVCTLLFAHNSLHAESNDTHKKYYTTIEVQKGDTLWDISKRYMTEEYSDIQDYMQEVQNINHIDGNHITAGCYLTVPYYAVEPIEH